MMAMGWIPGIILIALISPTNGDICRFGDGCMFPCHCEGGAPCDPDTGDCGDAGCYDGEIGSPSDTVYITPWNGPGCQIGNVAFEKTASQGPNTDFTYDASYANDGDHNRNSGMRGCSWASSPNMVPAWWEVDLGDDYVINYISVTTRDINAKQYLQHTDVGIRRSGSDASSYNITACEGLERVFPTPKLRLLCQPGVVARYVRLQDTRKRGDWSRIQMCEVEVVGYLYRECGCPEASPGCLECAAPLPGGCVCPGGSPGCLQCLTPLPGVSAAVNSGPGTDVIAGAVVAIILVIVLVVVLLVFLRKNGLLKKPNLNFKPILPVVMRKAKYDADEGVSNDAYYTGVDVVNRQTGSAIDRTSSAYQEINDTQNPKLEAKKKQKSSSPRGIKNEAFDSDSLPKSGNDTYADTTSSHYQEIESIPPPRAVDPKKQRIGAQPDVVISGPLRAHRETSNRKASSPEQAHTITSPSLPDRTNVKHVGKGPDLAYANMHLYGNEAPVTRAIRVPDLRQYLRDVRKNQGILVREFQMLPTGAKAIGLIGHSSDNKKKNRYNNIIAYDHSRVTLDDGEPGDFINANYITIPGKKEVTYIATQAPRKHTVADFWRMTWHCGVNRIVMLTNLCEAGKVQCVQYWPEVAAMDVGSFRVTLISEIVMADYTARTFTLTKKKQKKSRCVLQFHFTGWPDKGVPLMASSLLDFRRKLRSHDDLAEGPLLVHCSAGVGRTGAFIALDACLNQAQHEGQVDILKVAGIMRTCRPGMIQTLEQYLFVHDALLEATISADTCIPCSEMEIAYTALLATDPKTKHSKLHHQFQVLDSLKPPAEPNHPRGLAHHNIDKNRHRSIIPRDSRRPVLSTPVRGSICNDYVNAVYVDGYRCRSAYIATQLPLESTVVDFWRLAYDHQICSIVLLENMSGRAQGSPVYWPEEHEETKSWSPLSVNLTESIDISDANIVVREITVTCSKRVGADGPAQTLKQFHLQSWSHDEEIPPVTQDLFVLLDFVQRWQQQTQNKPVIVQCLDGNKLTGLFCAACYMIEKLKADQEVDVFLAVKQVRLARPQFIQTEAQFKFLYDLAVAYMKRNDMYANFK